MHGLRPAILGIVLGPWGHRDAAARVHWLARRRRRLAFCIGRTKRRTGRRTMRAIGLVLLSIAIMALLLTDADAKRRASAQGSRDAGAQGSWWATYPSQGLNDNCGYSSFNQCYSNGGPGLRRLLPTQSVSGHAFRDRLHLVRSDALELRRVRRLAAYGTKRRLGNVGFCAACEG